MKVDNHETENNTKKEGRTREKPTTCEIMLLMKNPNGNFDVFLQVEPSKNKKIVSFLY